MLFQKIYIPSTYCTFSCLCVFLGFRTISEFTSVLRQEVGRYPSSVPQPLIVNGKWGNGRHQLTPALVEKRKIPGTEKVLKVKGDTEIFLIFIDRACRFLKERLDINQKCRVGLMALRAKLRSPQYQCWCRTLHLLYQAAPSQSCHLSFFVY